MSCYLIQATTERVFKPDRMAVALSPTLAQWAYSYRWRQGQLSLSHA
jgi:hypothetical protein